MPDDPQLHENIQKRQTHPLQRRAAQNAEAPAKEGANTSKEAITMGLVAAGGALLVVGLGILILGLPFLQAQLAKGSCPEGEGCNVKVREYQDEVLSDIPDLDSSAWFHETPSPTSTKPPATRKNTWTPTPTETLVQLPALRPAPIVELLENGRCRKGAGTAYDVMAYLQQGSIATIVGRNADSSWWMIQVGDQQPRCWVWSALLTTSDDTREVLFVASPPLPTPTSAPEPHPPAPTGCWVTTPQNPNGVCLPRACTRNDFPGTSCTP